MRTSFKSISFLGLGNIVNTILGFIYLTAVARSLSLEDFGKYALLTSLLTFMAKGTDFGTNSIYISKSITTNEKSLTNIFYLLKLVLLVILIPISLFILNILNIKDINILTIFILGLFAYCINFTLYTIFQKHEKYMMLIIVNTIIAFIKGIFAGLILLNVFKPSLTSAFGIFSLAVYPSLILIYFLPEEFKKFSSLKISLQQLKEYIKGSAPAGISLLVSEGWSFIANLITKFAKDFSNVGIYSLADKLSNIFSLISFSIFTVLLPKNSIRKRNKMEYDFRETLLISVGIIVLAFAGMLASSFLVVPIFGESFKESLPIIYILFLASAFMAINGFMENYFYVENKTQLLLPIAILKVTIFILVSILLLPTYEVSGVALASLLSSFLVTALMSYIILKTRVSSIKIH